VIVVLASPAEPNLKTYGSQLPLLVILFCWIIVSILASQYPRAGRSNLSLDISWVMACYLITKAVNSEGRFLFFLASFLLFSFKMSQHGFRCWASSGFQFNREGVIGAPGWFHNSGEVGIQMCIFLSMLLHFMFAGWKQWGMLKRITMLAVLVTVIGTVVGSSSRGALIGSGGVLCGCCFAAATSLAA
jgi:hypothetical protein